jgi:hypothetical protein
MTFEYFKEKIEGKKIINQNFLILSKIGEGSFWSVFKVERIEDIDSNSSLEEKNIYALKEGNLNLIIPEDHIIHNKHNKNFNENNDDLEKNIYNNFEIEENLDLIQDINDNDNVNDNYNIDLDELYSDKNIEKGNTFINL